MNAAPHRQSSTTPKPKSGQPPRDGGSVTDRRRGPRQHWRAVVWLVSLRDDVRQAARALLRQPGFAGVTVLTFALGLALVTVQLSFVNGALLNRLPYPRADQVLRIDAQQRDGTYPVSYRAFLEWQTQQRSFDRIRAYVTERTTLSAPQLDSRRSRSAALSATLLPVLEVRLEHKVARLDLRWWRVSFDAGLWSSSAAALPTITVDVAAFASEGGGLLGRLSLGYRVTSEWVAYLGIEIRLLEASAYDGAGVDQDFGRTAMIMSFSLGARYYLPSLASRSAVKPYVSAGMGPVLALDVKSHDLHWWLDHHAIGEQARLMAAFGGHLGAGVDFQVSNWLVLGADVAYHLTSDFSQRMAGHRNGIGLAFALQFGVNLGRRMPDKS